MIFDQEIRSDHALLNLNSEFEQCTIIDCDFKNEDLSKKNFIQCEFINCDFSNSLVNDTKFQECSFAKCKLIGLQFTYCSGFRFAINFKDCILNNASFYEKNLTECTFENTDLSECDFEACDLSGVSFEQCELRNAIFERSNLSKADFTSAVNFSINPESNKIRGAKFSKDGLPGLLDRYGIIVT